MLSEDFSDLLAQELVLQVALVDLVGVVEEDHLLDSLLLAAKLHHIRFGLHGSILLGNRWADPVELVDQFLAIGASLSRSCSDLFQFWLEFLHDLCLLDT